MVHIPFHINLFISLIEVEHPLKHQIKEHTLFYLFISLIEPQHPLSRGYIVKFTAHFTCWKYFDECLMDKNLLHISLTKFNKVHLNRSLKIIRI